MFLLHIDIPGMDVDQVEEALDDMVHEGFEQLAEEIEWEIRRRAGDKLTETRDVYLNNLSVDAYGDEIQVQLTHPLAAAVEGGSKSFNLKPGFLKGAQAKIIPLTGRDPKGTGPYGLRFRWCRQNSPGWIHPGITPRNFATDVANDVEDIYAPRVFTDLIERIRV